MEIVEVTDHFGGLYRGKRVLVTGHTGFKGSWLCLWLHKLGAEVSGISLPEDGGDHYDMLDIPVQSYEFDIGDRDVIPLIQEIKPEIVFHLAAQSLVRKGYQVPIETYQTNVMGALHIYEACRRTDSVQAVVSVTSDKVYENKEWHWPYRENDSLGGKDPYSSSKACVELMTSSYRQSYLIDSDVNFLLTTARSGNVIGGGDWAQDRIIPDAMRATSKGEFLKIRNPSAVRPWQHVLDPLSGYLLLGKKLLEGDKQVSRPWNFGPNEANHSVQKLVDEARNAWSKLKFELDNPESQWKEAGILHIDNSLARVELQWQPVWGFKKSVEKTINWYRDFYEKNTCSSESDLNAYLNDAVNMQREWAIC